MRNIRPGLTISILALLSCLLLLAWLLFSLLAFKTAANDLYSQKGEHARLLLATFINQLPETLPTYPSGIIAPDSPAATYVQKLAADAAFTRLTLLDADGRVIYTAGRDSGDVFQPFAGFSPSAQGSFILPDGSAVAHLALVSRGGVGAGRAGLILSLKDENQRLERSRHLLTAYFVIDFMLLLGFGAYILSRIVVLPVNRLLAATERITGGHYGHSLRVAGCSELARLAESFNDMSQVLLEKDRQVSEHVAALEQANNSLHQAREETVRSEKMASIGLLAAGMAHEIGTPLASIMGYAELLDSEQLDSASVQDFARRISEESARIDRIVRGLQDYARPRLLAAVACDVPELLSETIELLNQQGVFKSVQVASQTGSGLDQALADPHQLQQVLVNLMLNARDAMGEGGRLQLYADNCPPPPFMSAGRSLRIDVVDNGSGIDETSLQQIFDPFFTTKEPGKGTGLGLAISSRIVEGFGGRITAESRPGSGSRFTLWLPSRPSRPEEP